MRIIRDIHGKGLCKVDDATGEFACYYNGRLLLCTTAVGQDFIFLKDGVKTVVRRELHGFTVSSREIT